MIKYSTRRLKKTPTTLVQQSRQTPRATTTQLEREVTIRVKYKSGEPASPSNYRPICSIPILYKLFSLTIFQNDYNPRETTTKLADQAGFRPGYSTTDHLFTSQQLRQRATKWHQPLWVAAIDIKKAFDRHKQGDPLSTLFFNSLLQYVMKPIAEKWKKCNHGVRLAEHDPNTNLSQLQILQTTLISPAANSNARPRCQTTSTQLRRPTAHNSTPRNTTSSPIRHQSAGEPTL